MNFFDEVFKTIKKIPRGKVATYGQVAALSGSPRATKQVGWALHQTGDKGLEKVPWHRVVNRQGRISIIHTDHPAEE